VKTRDHIHPLTQLERIQEHLAARAKTSRGHDRIEEVQFYSSGWANGDSVTGHSGIMAVGNWNDISDYKDGKSIVADQYPKKFGDILECCGVDLQWSDQVNPCDVCFRLIETQPSHHGWKEEFVVDDGELVCLRCLAEDTGRFEDHVRPYEGKPRLLNENLDLTVIDFVQLEIESDTNGLGGTKEKAMPIALESFKACGVRRVIFAWSRLNSWSSSLLVWIHKEDLLENFKESDDIKAFTLHLNVELRRLVNELTEEEQE